MTGSSYDSLTLKELKVTTKTQGTKTMTGSSYDSLTLKELKVN